VATDALSRIQARGPIGIRLGLARMCALLAELGDPQVDLRGVLIAGTNGKGSVAAMVAAVARAAGYSTMQSPSPHLHSYRERITIDGQPIEATDLNALLERVLEASQPGEAEHGPATEFELLTAAAYLWSARQHIDLVVMEVGLGGRLDASNAWDPDVAAVTNVGLDHQEYLGDTIESVAVEKAQVIKAGSRAVTGASGTALRVVEARAREVRVPLEVCQPLEVEAADLHGLTLRHERLGRLEVPLLGRHQAANASVAIGALRALEVSGVLSIPDRAVGEGLATVRWPGRLELRRLDGLWVIFDGAHNPDGATVLAATVDELASSLPAGRATLLTGVMADKDVAGMLRAWAGSKVLGGANIVATGVPESERALPAADLASAWSRLVGRPVDGVADDANDALEAAVGLARRDGGPLVVAGSLYLVGHARALLLPEADAD
jgi:dihydrofolate synthase/folylpolyglutamate synthase